MFKLGDDKLTIEKVIAVSKGEERLTISPEVAERIENSRRHVEKMAAGDRAVYGINTGFGPLCDTKITPEETGKLQENLLISHAVGVGKPISKELSRIMLICKVHALCMGWSGARRVLIDRILLFLEKDLIPAVPEKGSVGASGDLAPLSHLFLPIIGKGEFITEAGISDAATVLKEHEIKPLSLAAKEGLALINGTQFILAHAVFGLHKMKYLLDLADLAGAMSVEGCQGSASPFKSELHAVRAYPGTQLVANRMRNFLEGSENLNSHTDCDRVQDPYSLRCIPQVHGASRNAYEHLREMAEIELNSVTDNPIVLSEDEAISGGNFHGQPLAMVLDYATLAAAELGNIADRRCYLLLEGKFGLPRLLTRGGGLNSGFMIPQYTTAALVSENKTLCFPASADSIPTSLGQEDHVSMGSISGRKFCAVLFNLERILAIELMYAAQAMDFRRPLKFSASLEYNHALIRKSVSYLEDDRLLKEDIKEMVELVENRVFEVS